MKVIVIGAGVAGLTAARELKSKNINTTILESSSRIGGRIHYVTTPNGHFSLGASWIHGINKNPITKIIGLSNLQYTDWSKGKLYDSLGDPIPKSKRAMSKYFEFIKSSRRERDKSLQESLNEFFQLNPEINSTNLNVAITSMIETEYGTDIENLSSNNFDEEGEMQGGDYLVDDYSKLITYLSRGLDIKIDQRVIKIEKQGSQYNVITSDSEYLADHVITAINLNALKLIKYDPALPPKKTDSINKIKLGNFHKTWIVYDRQFWDDYTNITIVRSRPFFTEFIDTTSVMKKPTLLALHAGKDADELIKISKSKFPELIKESLSLIYPKAPDPVEIITSEWHNDPEINGSYSYIPVGANLSDIDNIAERYENLHFAGEHTHSDYIATVHGAYFSGLRAAEEVLSSSESKIS